MVDLKKKPGINFECVNITRLDFRMPSVAPSDFKYKIDFTHSFEIRDNRLVYNLGVFLYDGFYINMTGMFSIIEGEENFDLKTYAKYNAPATILPYIRESISYITANSPLPHLLLPPINVYRIIDNKGKMEQSKVENTDKTEK